MLFLPADISETPDSGVNVKSRKQPIAPKYLSVPNVARYDPVEGGQFSGDAVQSRLRSWTLPSSIGAKGDDKVKATIPGIRHFFRSRVHCY